eukprot:TRINITY_DN5121_c0_g1_i1.p1 TRINITY_DN5121_c0_g1~~TRINITY_DN5121_c0_g1_i1.p1  ORF type:complete len:367 (+),score=87.01 TRINITY_DN5121_c0_g1_i1:3-1103(+)
MIEEEVTSIVLDVGTDTTRAGFSGEESPLIEFPTVIGTELKDEKRFKKFIGSEALIDLKNRELNYPLKNAQFDSYDDMELIWEKAFREMKIDPQDYSVLLTEALKTSKFSRERIVQSIFETFSCPEGYLSRASILSNYATGYGGYGCMVDIGAGVTQICNLFEARPVANTSHQNNLAGVKLTEFLGDKLNERGYAFQSTDFHYLNEIKNKNCFVAYDFEMEIENAKKTRKYVDCELPDGNIIKLASEKFVTMEGIFRPALLGLEQEGLHQLIYDSLMQCDIDIQSDLFNKVIISGGTSLCPGLKDRLEKELKLLNNKFKVVAQEDRKNNSWVGGSIQATLPTFQQMWITKAEYEESGPTIVHRYCF